MAETPLCHTCHLRGVSRPATVRGWHRSRWRLEAACADHASALARVLPLAPAAPPTSAPAAPPPWVRAGSPRPGGVFAGLVLPARQPSRPRPAPAAGPLLCRTCQLRGTSTPATVRGWHRSRWRLEAACADHAGALARPLALAAPVAAPARPDAPAPSPVPAPAPPPARARRRRPVLLAAGGVVLAGAAAVVGVLAAGGSSPASPAPAPSVSGAALAAAPGAVRVPQLIGRSLRRARGSLNGVRLVVARRRSAAAQAGVILAQRPRPGVSVPRGSALLVTVALPILPPAPAAEAQVTAAAPAPPGPAGESAPGGGGRTPAAGCGPGWGQAWGAFRCR
jgi:hypothetical protein